MNIPQITLNNGVTMPQIGLGVWQTKDGEEVEMAVKAALDAGYRMIDTASLYGNEEGVGNAIKASGVPREEIFVTTKLWNNDQPAEKVRPAFELSLKKLGLEYIDLYLIHWPVPAKRIYNETWEEFEKLYAEGKVRAIGVSNFMPEHLDDLLTHASIVPVINQIELHPQLPQFELRDYCQAHGIQVESWSPIGGTGGKLLTNQTLIEIGNKYNKSAAQVVIRWHLQNDLVVIPKSTHPERIKQNIDVFDFELTDQDMERINSLENGKRQGPNPMTMNNS